MRQLHPKPDYGEDSYRGCGRLTGQVALITEAESGVGRAVALAFAREGADLALAALERNAEIDETARLVQHAGRRAVVLCGDVRDEDYRQFLVKSTIARLGSLSILVTSSALEWTHGSFESASASDMELELRTHNESVIFLSQIAAAEMRDGGSIIHTTPLQSAHPVAQQRAYVTTAMAITNFVAGQTRELAKRGIRVNAVAPGAVWTPRIIAMLPPESVQQYGQDTLLGKPAQPAEIAPVYVFLASPEAKLVSGAVIQVGH